ncbi:MAG: site-2 protease family protein [Anaerolineales bacterium]|jgi:membrane-associated protease RseP (regulator of RpoE activity)|uniref:site-2 protease family protein n=1 Tax=Candidatus Villigracilis affinis TaxID=3140682 RepID=UPI001DBD9225|nr:site-2 protease family protein [Anaerolineales bacterium]MBK9602478.1 site-2 protease family protein [Anaerolineales bacterium]MBL0347175.1 site-2 protease family protein [Anaerolineales bacterium]
MSIPETEVLTNLVARVFRIEDVTSEDPRKGFFLRYRGELLNEDSASLYDTLAESLSPHGITPLFRMEETRQIIYLAPKLPEPKQDNISTNIILFVLTVLSVMLAGAQPEGPVPDDFMGQLLLLAKSIFTGWPFALSLLGILLTHELGHYFMSRYHKTPATLPYFIPLPLSLLGTMGAAIIMRGIPKNKRVLFDIGVAGPIAGLIVALPVLFYGLSLSTLSTIDPNPNGFIEGNSLMYLLAKYITFGQLLPSPVAPQGILYWLQYFFTGRPVPFGGLDVFIHPVAFAGWAGLLVTGLNLIPAGTLDGGHVIYGLFGEKARKGFPFIIGILAVLGIFWSGWWIWAMLLFWLGRVNAEPLDQITTLDPPRRLLGFAMIIVFLLVFMPVPFMTLAQ